MPRPFSALIVCLMMVWLPLSFNTGGQTDQNRPVTIRLWHIATPSDPFHPVLQDAIERFNTSHPNVLIEAHAIDNASFQTHLAAVMGTDQQPDAFQTWGGGMLRTYLEAGLVRPIPELGSGTTSPFLPQALANATFDNQVYAVPANLAGVFLWYNQALFMQHQLELPTTWDQLIHACGVFRQAGITPVAVGNQQRWPGGLWWNYLALRLGAWEDSTSATTPIDTNAIFARAGHLLLQAVQAGCFEANLNQTDYGQAQQMLAQGTAAMQLQGDWNLPGLRNANSTLVDESISVLPFPTLEAGTPVYQHALLGGTGQAFAVSHHAPPETAAVLVELLTSPEFGQAVVAAGFIPALNGYEAQLAHPLVQRMSQTIREASAVQLYYDQSLPPAAANTYLELVRQLLDVQITPQQMADQLTLATRGEAADAFASAEAAVSLRGLAEARGIAIGSAVAIDPLRNDPTYADVLRREFNLITPETSLKMDVLRPDRTTYNFSEADSIVDYAQANGMQVRGHTLVWHRQLPGWLENGTFSRDELIAILREHIHTVVGRYQGRIRVWDVVNEAFNEDGTLRDSVWLRGIGPEYIDYAFQFAHEADPQAILFYNDYNTEDLSPKSTAVYALVQGMVERGIPIHGVGLQMHITISHPLPVGDVQQNLNRITALGLQVQITEMDVRLQGSNLSREEQLRQQAQYFAAIADLCFQTQACTAFVVWGFTDRYTWIPGYTGYPDQPLLFDADYVPKPAYYALVNSLVNIVER
ncbi:MAG: extracellular solute-binding protein [bacterium]|nr:extracellular solute-binding protein [bacterium]